VCVCVCVCAGIEKFSPVHSSGSCLEDLIKSGNTLLDVAFHHIM
jgi:hypothetical protein